MEDNKPKNNNEIQVELSEEMAQGTYANLAVISHSASEFILDFIRVVPGAPKAQVKSRVIFVVIVKLLIWNRAIIADPMGLFFIHTVYGASVDHRGQSHFPELFNSCLYHFLKSKLEADIYGLFLCNILSPLDKADPVAFCIGPCHSLDLFFRQSIQESRHSQFIF